MAIAANATPDALTKKFFIVTLLGVVAYLTAVIVLMLTTPAKLPTDTPDQGVTHVSAPHPASSPVALGEGH